MGLWLGDKPAILERVGPFGGTGCHRWTRPLALVTAYTIAVSLLPSPMKSTALLTLACLSALPAVVLAQEAEPRNRVVIVENVKFDYAQVLNVEPVFQTLRATRTEEHCEPVSTRTLAPVNVTGEEPVEDKGRISRFWDSVRSMFKRSDEEASEEVAAETPAPAPANNGPMLTRACRIDRKSTRRHSSHRP
ncbi:hypothetical protein G6F35_014680 [Rhizopus arrhizus]|nr:hypothetical protein G6F35_014680 [Rhizopus arrhizus]